MNPPCGKCSKAVYPTEKLQCLDKSWHRGCFKCWECGMTLNMKNYKGYNKLPYCNAHYPKTKATVVADTPEGRRIAENTKIQSQINYHADFEKGKGHYTPVSDDKELNRLRQNQEKFSEVRYHEEFEKNIKGSKIQVADDPEMSRIRHNTAIQSEVEYRGMRGITAEMEQRRANIGDDRPSQPRAQTGPMAQPGPMANFNPTAPDQHQPSPYQAKHTGATIFDSERGRVDPQPSRRIGSIDDYDPMNERFGSIGQGYRPTSSGYGSQQWEETVPEPRSAVDPASPKLPEVKPAPVFEPEPVPQIPPEPDTPEPGSPMEEEPRQQHYPPPQQHQPPPQSYQPPPQSYQPPPPTQQPPPAAANPMASAVYKAMYDYEAADEDEVSFKDGDTIVDIEIIDDGWMYGTVRRTKKRGMLPANYVERVQ